MARRGVSDWYTPRFGPYGGYGPPKPGYESKFEVGGRGHSPAWDLMGERERIGRDIARTQLDMMKEQLRAARRGNRGGARWGNPSLQDHALMQAINEARFRQGSREQMVGSAMRQSSGDRGFDRMRMHNTLARFIGGGGGAVGMGAFPERQPSFAQQAQRARIADRIAASQGSPYKVGSGLNNLSDAQMQEMGSRLTRRVGGGYDIAPPNPYGSPLPEGPAPPEVQATGSMPHPGQGPATGTTAWAHPATDYSGGPTPGQQYNEAAGYQVVTAPGQIPWRQKGGGIPKTGPYQLHKGELVVSADQVDEPLMAYLMRDKAQKVATGQMDGKGTGPGKRKNPTMGSYQVGNIPTPVIPPPPPGFSPNIPEGLDQQQAIVRGLNRQLAAIGGDMFMLPEDQPVHPQALDETRRLLEAERAKTFGEGMGVGGGGISSAFIPKVANVPPKAEVTPFHEQWKPGILDMYRMQGDPGVGRLGRMAEGLVTPEQPVEELGAIPDITKAAEPRHGTYAGALAQWERGEGRGEKDHLVLTGEADPIAPNERARQIRSEEQKLSAQKNRAAADRLYQYLQTNISLMDPKEYQAMAQRAQRFDKLADIAEGREAAETKSLQQSRELMAEHKRVMDRLKAEKAIDNVIRMQRSDMEFFANALNKARGLMISGDTKKEEIGRDQARQIISSVSSQLGNEMSPEEIEEIIIALPGQNPARISAMVYGQLQQYVTD